MMFVIIRFSIEFEIIYSYFSLLCCYFSLMVKRMWEAYGYEQMGSGLMVYFYSGHLLRIHFDFQSTNGHFSSRKVVVD